MFLTLAISCRIFFRADTGPAPTNPTSHFTHLFYKLQFIISRKEKYTMKFVKGMLIGTAIAAGMAIMYNDGMMNKKRIMKRGKQLAKKLGAF